MNGIMLTNQDFSKIKLLLKDHPTKKEIKLFLKDYPTKQEIKMLLKDHPTKLEIKKMLQDYPTREELYKHLDFFGKALSEKFDDSLKNYPTKDELFKRLDHIVGELETIRTEQLILIHDQAEHESNIKSLQKIHPQGRHAFPQNTTPAIL